MFFYSKLKAVIHELGFINFIIYKLNSILSQLSKGKIRIIKYYFFAQPIPKTLLLKKSIKRKITTIPAPTQLDDPLWLESPRPLHIIEMRFKQHSKCYIALKNEKFIGFIWFNEGAYFEDEVRCQFMPLPKNKAAWDFDVYVNPKNRFSRAFPMLWDSVNQHLSSKGFEWTMSRISISNIASLSTHKKLGAKYCGQATFICIGAFQCMLASQKPFISFSISSRPKLFVSLTKK